MDKRMDSLSFKRKTFYIFDKYYVNLYYLFSDDKNNLHIEIKFKDNDLFNNSNNLNESELFSYLDDEDVTIKMRYEKEILVPEHCSIRPFGGFLSRRYIPSYVEKRDVLEKTFRGYLEEGLNEIYVLLFSNQIKIDYPIQKFIFLRNEFSAMAYEYFSNEELSNAIKKNLLKKNDRLVSKFTKDKIANKDDFLNFKKGLKDYLPRIGIESFLKEINPFVFIWKSVSFFAKLSIILLVIFGFANDINMERLITSYQEILELNIFEFILGSLILLLVGVWGAVIINFIINIPGYILSFAIEIYLHLKCILLKRSFDLNNKRLGLKKTFLYDKDMLYFSSNSFYKNGFPAFSSEIELLCCSAILAGCTLLAAFVWIIVFILCVFNLIISFF